MRGWIVYLSCASALACVTPGSQEKAPRSEPSVQGRKEAFSIARVEKVDLLFVIDNSNSMAGEQAQLRAQFPRLMEALTTGRRSPDDPRPFTPVRDLHVGVVSTDMGIPGVELPPSCHADGGDDGQLQHAPRGESCADQYPPFLSYQAGSSNAVQLAQDFACVAALGTGGCGFEEQLEAPLKALSPRVVLDADGRPTDEMPTRFIATAMDRTLGRGDLPVERGGNLGFLRNDPSDPSLLAIVLMTDEEDCSVKDTQHLKPNNQLPEGDPLRAEDINLRCFNHPELKYDVRERYLKGFRALRPGREDLVVFSAIAGVPPDLVDANVIASTDFTDESSREAFYQTIMNDPRMQAEVDPATLPGSGQGNIKPSCVRPPPPGEEHPSTAFPPRRIVELARAFGPMGMVQSICQDDFGPAIDMLVYSMAKSLSEMCMPQRLVRNDSDLVSCKLIWQLPRAEDVQAESLPAETPTACSQLPQSLVDEDLGDQRCAIHQLAVADGAVAEGGDGWYYDDFTPNLDALCAAGLQRIAFSEGAAPPPGVSVKLECEAGAQVQ